MYRTVCVATGSGCRGSRQATGILHGCCRDGSHHKSICNLQYWSWSPNVPAVSRRPAAKYGNDRKRKPAVVVLCCEPIESESIVPEGRVLIRGVVRRAPIHIDEAVW